MKDEGVSVPSIALRAPIVGWVAAVKAATYRDEFMMGSATLNPSYVAFVDATSHFEWAVRS